MNPFSIGAVAIDGAEFTAVFRGDEFYDVRDVLPGISTIRQLFAEWDANLDAIAAHLGSADAAPQSLSELTRAGRLQILPPVQPMGTIFAAGVNYREHIIEMAVAH